MKRFTRNVLTWAPERHLAAAVDAHPVASDGDKPLTPYNATLALDDRSFAARSALYKLVMYGRPGLSRPGREYLAAVASMLTGCRYCVSVHAQRLAELTKRPADVDELLRGGPTFGEMRDDGLDSLAASVTLNNRRDIEQAVAHMIAGGMTEAEVFDAANVAAMFAWANRLMMTLGTATGGDDAPSAAGSDGARIEGSESDER